MIQFSRVSRTFGSRLALDEVSFTAVPGKVTGFLGPNGSGKTTSLRILLGLDRPDAGSATIGGKRYCDLVAPLHRVGALLDAASAHPGRSGWQHLTALALTHGIGKRRVLDVIEEVGLSSAAMLRVKGYSLGMRQRLGIAAALLGDPDVLVFDEPINGLDPDGVRWFRNLVTGLAHEGRTVLLSSHIISELEHTADQVIVLGKGRVLADLSLDALAETAGESEVIAMTSRPELLAREFAARAEVRVSAGEVRVTGVSAEEVGTAAMRVGATLRELRTCRPSLEDAYLRLTAHEAEFVST